jgi:site-specific recombinase XerD
VSSVGIRGKAQARPSCSSRSAVRRSRRRAFLEWWSGLRSKPNWVSRHTLILRHACGYKLANEGQDTRAIQAYLGHRNIQNTTQYTALALARFKEIFRD